jgi:hypothetical protein
LGPYCDEVKKIKLQMKKYIDDNFISEVFKWANPFVLDTVTNDR